MTTSISARLLATLLALGACASPKPDADTAAVAPVDTVKPLVVQVPDTPPRADSVARPPATKSAARGTGAAAKTGTTTRTDSIIGRDSVIMPKGKGGLPPVRTDTNTSTQAPRE